MLFHELRLSGLLSFGPEGMALPMEPLNVLIGPNGSGKSNFLEAIALLRGASGEVTELIARAGGTPQWRWKGPNAGNDLRLHARLEITPVGRLEHEIAIGDRSGSVAVIEERIEPAERGGEIALGRCYFRPQRAVMLARGLERTVRAEGEEPGPGTDLAERGRSDEAPTEAKGVVEYPEDFRPGESVLRYAASPEHPVLWHLREKYAGIRLYRDWAFGPGAENRVPTSAHGRSDFLDEGAWNLAVVLSHLHGEHKRRFLEATSLFEGIVDVLCPVTGGVVSLFLEESGGRSIPASRLSDGTLRYLSLLAILLHPKPPPVICIEGPELGLHPDLMPTIADLLVEASEHTQLVVTTHSDILVDALTEHPECIVVCEKHDGQTTMRRLDRERTETRSADYRLGDLWTSGELGGKPFGSGCLP